MALPVPTETSAAAAVFPRFDVVSDSSDHYYHNNSINGGKLQKKITQEWKILEKHLPDSIFVRVYEDRIDLLRAVIVGASGTPYHDGIYLFDIAFPSDYPARPPFVCYGSFGFRINPNLYANGRVCLSLLNTWSGKKNEKWNPNQSTVLQVLVSIQALVLNEKPFFNEPGFSGFRGKSSWEKTSNSYSSDMFVLCCKTMLFHQRRPPKHFESFVAGHFKERGAAVLSACNVYVNGGASIGHYDSTSSSSSSSSKPAKPVKVPGKFKSSIQKLYPQLVEAFTKNGASLGTLSLTLEVEDKTTAFSASEKKSKDGVFSKLKKFFGFLKKSGKSNSVKKHLSLKGKSEEGT